MSSFLQIAGLVLFFVLIAFATKFYLKRKKIREVSKSAWGKYKREIIKAIEEIGEEQSNALLLFLEDRDPTEKLTINIPGNISTPWSGKSIEISTKDKVTVSLLSSTPGEFERASELLTPRIKLKNGKSQYIWSPDRYLSKSKKLRSFFSELNESEQLEALYRIIGSSIRINGGLSWVQAAEFPNCSVCN